MNPYVGITDFTDFRQVRRMFETFIANRRNGSQRRLHVGVMMSYKTLHDIPTLWQNVFPPKRTIAGIFASDDVYNCLHYADYEGRPDFWQDLCRAIMLSGIGIHALQLDMIWPDPVQIANGVHASRKSIEVILQIGKHAFEAVGNDPQEVVEKLGDYQGVVHRVLLDKSMGRGLGMDAEGLRPFVAMIKNRFPEMGIGVAGGLGPETIHLVEPLVKEFPDLSIDAQGRLRPSGDIRDPIDWDMAGKYLVEAFKILS